MPGAASRRRRIEHNDAIFPWSTAVANDQIVTTGGRVLNVTALGSIIAQAKLNAYRAVKCIRWKGAWCRKDISDMALG